MLRGLVGSEMCMRGSYAAVRAAIPADRILEWSVTDGWAPICAALDLSLIHI